MNGIQLLMVSCIYQIYCTFVGASYCVVGAVLELNNGSDSDNNSRSWLPAVAVPLLVTCFCNPEL